MADPTLCLDGGAFLRPRRGEQVLEVLDGDLSTLEPMDR